MQQICCEIFHLNDLVHRSAQGLCPTSVPLRPANNDPNVTWVETGARQCFSEGLNADGIFKP